MNKLLLLPILSVLVSCNSNDPSHNPESSLGTTVITKNEKTESANEHMNHNATFEELTKQFEDKSRVEWQKPDELIASLGEIKGKKIVDIGCGTGYFAFRMAEKGAEVICADIDDRFLTYVDMKKAELQMPDKSLYTLKTEENSPTLGRLAIDKALIVNTYHHIQDRTSYFEEVRQSLMPAGEVIVVDFKKEMDLDFGPPKSMRISKEQVIEEMTQAGFSSHTVDTDLLPYQYVLKFYFDQ